MSLSPPLPERTLAQVYSRILQAVDTSKEVADLVGTGLAAADARNHASHGSWRVSQYVDFVQAGRIDPTIVTPKTLFESPVETVFDGQKCFGQVMTNYAVNHACDKARHGEFGSYSVSFSNSDHIGRLATHCEAAIENGFLLIAMAGCFGQGRIAPPGGKEKRLGTNPILFGIPRADGKALMVDTTTSSTAEGKCRVAKFAKKQVPRGWLIDSHGHPSTDPEVLYQGPPYGTILPMGAHKGFGLGLLVQLMTCVMARTSLDPRSGMQGANIGWIHAVDLKKPDRHSDYNELVSSIELILEEWFRTSAPIDSENKILMPNEPEIRFHAQCVKTGVPVAKPIWAEIMKTADKVGADFGGITSQNPYPP
jgi:uncharacterized oxidoreductase